MASSDETLSIGINPGASETEFGREGCTVFTREMLLTADPEMAIVRIFGSDKSGNAVRVGFTPERALRIGAAFIRAGLSVKPSLRAQLIEDTTVLVKTWNLPAEPQA